MRSSLVKLTRPVPMSACGLPEIDISITPHRPLVHYAVDGGVKYEGIPVQS